MLRKERGAKVVFLGTIGTWQYDIDTLVRTLQSKAQHLLSVYEAGPCGYWFSEVVCPTPAQHIVFQE
jgi:hypothetical protein